MTSAIRDERTNRQGVKVYTVDTLHPGSPTSPYDGYFSEEYPETNSRWQAVCATHGTYVMVRTRRRAYEATVDTDFCEECQQARQDTSTAEAQ